jgi:hypothetical protein
VFPLMFLACLYGMSCYARDPIGVTSACSSLLSLVYDVRTRTLVVEKCSLRVEQPRKIIRNQPI